MSEKHFKNYNIDLYKEDLDKNGLQKTWDKILDYCLNNKEVPEILNVKNFGELYEIGLAHTNKIAKKELGKYYTPDDVANLMSSWLEPLKGQNICDVCCGTGNLILSYFNYIGPIKTKNILKKEQLYLYDIDPIALKICVNSIGIIYGKEYIDKIHQYNGDFLNENIVLPKNSKVISNPPYFKISEFNNDWEQTENLQKSKEFYSVIMEKIIKQSNSSVIITPYSFIGGEKFYPLRKVLNNYNGFIVSFDNVPGSIFNGRKHGIFNSNSSNSVRAAITVTENKKSFKGYRISPLIRFKNEERNDLLNNQILNKTIPNTYQIVSEDNKSYYKCFSQLEDCFNSWINNSNVKLKDLLSKEETKYKLCVPNSCRYFTVGTKKELERTGKYNLYFKNENDYNLAYCLINSSFCYWHWRLYDGGITYPLGLLTSIPIFFDCISDTDKEKLIKIATEMKRKEKQYLVYKKNASEMQENVKFPISYRNQINTIFLKNLGIKDSNILDVIHYNAFFNSKDGVM